MTLYEFTYTLLTKQTEQFHCYKYNPALSIRYRLGTGIAAI